ncbi:MAG TPA: DUF2203 domain-containing protein [Myxococcaceae bacterium]|nr:DUF2203 domain-containing protein [Myxococcaceae bacterium]HZA50812.1 DUF2203 domain-containing protein [Myxococcaceae bacterium]
MRVFDVGEARRYVPFLLEAFGRIQGWLDQAREGAAFVQGQTVTTDEVNRVRREVDRLIEQIRGELARIEDAGIEVKGTDGLVDFPAIIGGRHVYLCWKYPEQSVDFWHELEAGFAGRQPIVDDSAFERSWLS